MSRVYRVLVMGVSPIQLCPVAEGIDGFVALLRGGVGVPVRDRHGPMVRNVPGDGATADLFDIAQAGVAEDVGTESLVDSAGLLPGAHAVVDLFPVAGRAVGGDEEGSGHIIRILAGFQVGVDEFIGELCNVHVFDGSALPPDANVTVAGVEMADGQLAEFRNAEPSC